MSKAVAAQTAASAESTATEIGTSNTEGKADRRKMYDHDHMVWTVNWGIKHKKSGYHAEKAAKEHFCLVSPFTVPKQTAEKHIQYAGTQLVIKSGRKSFFTPEETGALSHMLLELHATGMGLESKQVRKVATSYLKLAGRGDLVTAKDSFLGRDWFYKFIVDHPFLSGQLSTNPVEISRVQSCTVPCIAHTYDLYEQLESKLGIR